MWWTAVMNPHHPLKHGTNDSNQPTSAYDSNQSRDSSKLRVRCTDTVATVKFYYLKKALGIVYLIWHNFMFVCLVITFIGLVTFSRIHDWHMEFIHYAGFFSIHVSRHGWFCISSFQYLQLNCMSLDFRKRRGENVQTPHTKDPNQCIWRTNIIGHDI